MCYMIERVGVRELRQNLSRWLRRVENGETFEVTDRGKPVARLAPVTSAGSALARLAAQGRLAQTGKRNLGELPPPAPARPGERPLSEILDELREDRI